MKPLLYDVFCGAGGATKGYQEAGFYVVGIDIKPQPHYVGDEFIQMDALQFLAELLAGKWLEPAMIHASPPCQRYSFETPMRYRTAHPDLLLQVATILRSFGKPYIVENVPNARHLLNNPIMLCGSMFGLDIWRHRYFETNPAIWFPPQPCDHSFVPVLITGTPRRKGYARVDPPVAARRKAIGIDWMVVSGLDEAIPPAYTRFIGERMMEYLQTEVMPC